MALALSPDGKNLAVGTTGKAVTFWDVATKKEQSAFGGHRDAMTALVFLAGGRELATGGEDESLRFWSATSGKELHHETAHAGAVTALAASADGRTLVSAGADGKVRVWDGPARREACTWQAHPDGVDSLCLSPDGKAVASASWKDERCVPVGPGRQAAPAHPPGQQGQLRQPAAGLLARREAARLGHRRPHRQRRRPLGRRDGRAVAAHPRAAVGQRLAGVRRRGPACRGEREGHLAVRPGDRRARRRLRLRRRRGRLHRLLPRRPTARRRWGAGAADRAAVGGVVAQPHRQARGA